MKLVGPEGQGFLKKNKTLADGLPIHFPRIPSYGPANPRTKPRNDLVTPYSALGPSEQRPKIRVSVGSNRRSDRSHLLRR